MVARCARNGLLLRPGAIHMYGQFVYTVVQGLWEEMAELFPEPFLHLGGDELNFNCWNQSVEIVEFMQNEGLQTDRAGVRTT